MYQVTNWENIEQRTKAASTVFAVGDVVANDGLGAIIPATTGSVVEGIILEPVLATDADFAVTRPVAIAVPSKDVDQFTAVVTNGPVVEGVIYDVDAADASVIDATAPGVQFKCVAVISDTLATFKFA